jgi:hypothetical protein
MKCKVECTWFFIGVLSFIGGNQISGKLNDINKQKPGRDKLKKVKRMCYVQSTGN